MLLPEIRHSLNHEYSDENTVDNRTGRFKPSEKAISESATHLTHACTLELDSN